MTEMTGFDEFKEHLKDEEEKIKKIADKYKKGFLNEVKKRIEKNGRKGLISIYSEIYPELKNIFKEDIEYFYYRIDSALAAEYICRYHEQKAKLLVVLDPSLDSTKKFKEYFGVGYKKESKESKEVDFLDLTGKFIIPMVTSLNPDHYDTPLWRDFFSEWKKRGLSEEFGYPPFANRFHEIAKICDGINWYQMKEEFSDEIIKILGNKAKKRIRVGRGLLKTEMYKYFSERLAWFKLLGYDMVVETILDLLKQGEIKLATNFVFSFHQLLPAHILYSKGGVVIYSENDLIRAIKTFNHITEYLRKKEEVIIQEILSWVSFSIPPISLRKAVKTMWRKIRVYIPLSNSPKERAKDNYIILEKIDDERKMFNEVVNETLHEMECKADKMLHEMESESDLNKIVEVEHSKVKELEEVANSLTSAYYEVFKSKPKKLFDQVLIALAIGLIGWSPILQPIISLLVSEGFGELVDRVWEHFMKEDFRKQFGFPVSTIPIDAWQIKRHPLKIIMEILWKIWK